MKEVSYASLDALSAAARDSARNRQHSNLHSGYGDPCQRLLNAIGVDSYIRPHRHAVDAKHESLFAIRGEFALLQFDDQGSIGRVVRFAAEAAARSGATAAGVEVEPQEWHTVMAVEKGSVLLEIKAGPYLPHMAKEFAPWAPDEGSADAAAYLQDLRRLAFR